MSKKKEEIDPEELMRRKFRAKCLFRALGRLAMANTYWLIEAVDDYEGVEDVQRRVEQAVRGKAKKQLLSVKDKALLNKPAQDRTDHEKKYIYRIIGGLKCFKRYPNHVKKKLAAVTYFKYYGPDRVIVREKQEAHALYFIVTGNVVVSQMIWDELLEDHVYTEIGRMTAGDMFGEVSLLHGIPRTATVTTVDHCEVLQVLKEDFKIILYTSVQKQWDQVRQAMSYFSYFDSLDEVSCREGCIMAKMKDYEPEETILGDGCGIPNHVYFILSGRVQMIESLEIIVTKHLGKTFYTLYDPYVSPQESKEEIDFEKKWFAPYKSKLAATEGSGSVGATVEVSTQTGLSSGVSILKHKKSKEGSTVIERSKSSVKQNEDELKEIKPSNLSIPEGVEVTKVEGTSATKVDKAVGSDLPISSEHTEDRKTSFLNEEEPKSEVADILLSASEEPRHSVRYSVSPEVAKVVIKDRRTKTYFMQVCIMNPGSTFGFGENMRDRRIVALTPVRCMLMPEIWLLQRNTANIWTRIKYYLNKKIPPKKALFEEFCKQRAWEDYRMQCVEDVIARCNHVNYTSAHDVPYSIRLEELLDI